MGRVVFISKYIIASAFILLVLFLDGCVSGFYCHSLNQETPYKIWYSSNLNSERDTSDYSLTHVIHLSRNRDDSLLVHENHKCKKIIRILFNDSVYETEVLEPHGNKWNYLANFNVGNDTIFDIENDNHILELYFMINDSVVNKYRYKHD